MGLLVPGSYSVNNVVNGRNSFMFKKLMNSTVILGLLCIFQTLGKIK